MIVKILSKSVTFACVYYNTNKVDRDDGELMKVSGFEALNLMQNIRPKDYANYLLAQSIASKRTLYPCFHAVISCKGRSHNKYELTIIAQKWLKNMGYEQQPYLLVFHKDTANNHLHIVSTRITRNGKRIDNFFEGIRAVEMLNLVMDIDVEREAQNDLEKAFLYRFFSRSQFTDLLKSFGYRFKHSQGKYDVIRYGRVIYSIPLRSLDDKINAYTKDTGRLTSVRSALLMWEDYNDAIPAYNREPILAEKTYVLPKSMPMKIWMLSEKFDIQVVFHGKKGLPPDRYTLIDHRIKTVFDGAELMPIQEFLKISTEADMVVRSEINDFPAIKSETVLQGRLPVNNSNNHQASLPFNMETPIDIYDDIDDEAVHGRKRNRKHKLNKR